MSAGKNTERIPCYCALCIARCGAIAVVEKGRFVALEPDTAHPTGQALCAKGRAAPELVYHRERLLYPLKRTRVKGDPDPGWQRIGWDEALDVTASNLRQLAEEHGPESIAFSSASPSTSAMSDSAVWLQRLIRALGTPNFCNSMELCGWGRGSTAYTFGVASVGLGSGGAMPDLENTGCILLWGYNPSLARLTHATSVVAALERGARLIVVDPRKVGLANKADIWLRVRPGTDGALALGIANVMIARGWYDAEFVRDWTNGPLLVHPGTGRFLTERDLSPTGSNRRHLAWDAAAHSPLFYDPAAGRYECDDAEPSLRGAYLITTLEGELICRTAFELYAEMCERYAPEMVAATCWIGPDQLETTARMMWEARPVSYYAWSGVEQQSNATQISRALGLLYALTGSFDAPGGNVVFAAVPTPNIGGDVHPATNRRPSALGMKERPLGPASWNMITSDELYRAVLQQQPYAVRGLVGFGANLLLSHSNSGRGRTALAGLDFYVHADLFMNPTAEMADVVLPVASPFEREGLKIGFDISPAAQSWVQLRRRVAEPRGEARSDVDIVFALACRLGLGDQFWEGDVEAAYRHQLGLSGLSLDELRDHPGGMAVPLRTHYRKHAEMEDGAPRGFPTRTRKIELYSEKFLTHGFPALPQYEEPLIGPVSRPELCARYPLVLTSAKNTLFCESQHRALPALRRRSRYPEVELHPDAAEARGIHAGDWVAIETPEGTVRARARLNESLDPRVVCGQHGWWQACRELGEPGYDPFSPDGANLNLIIGNAAMDPVSGSIPHRAYLCEIKRTG
jgi:anaerobic selenocysteine-containing dehydrogenase